MLMAVFTSRLFINIRVDIYSFLSLRIKHAYSIPSTSTALTNVELMVEYHFFSNFFNSFEKGHFHLCVFHCNDELFAHHCIFVHENSKSARHKSYQPLQLFWFTFIQFNIAFFAALDAGLPECSDIDCVLSAIVSLETQLQCCSRTAPSDLLTFCVDAAELSMKA
jgi:hypothetical protein